MSSLANHILHLHGALALALIFAFPAAETSVFVGFVFPGEIAAILGGVLASRHQIDLGAAIAAAILGAIVGETIGYFVGRRFGEWVLGGPLSRWVKEHHVDRTRKLIRRRGGWAVFLGRWVTALRVLVPGIAGMAEMPLAKFSFFNVLGGATWGATMVVGGWLAGSHWHTLVNTLGAVGIGIVVAVVVVVAVAVFVRRRRAAA